MFLYVGVANAVSIKYARTQALTYLLTDFQGVVLGGASSYLVLPTKTTNTQKHSCKKVEPIKIKIYLGEKQRFKYLKMVAFS